MSTTLSEQRDHHPAMEPESTLGPNPKHGIGCREGHPQYSQNAHGNWATVPKRKPVPGPFSTAAIGTEPGIVAATNKEHAQSGICRKRRNWPFLGLDGLDFRSQRRSRKILLIGAVAAIALIALIIGLAVGLTMGRHSDSNLPLPTSNGGPYKGDLTYYNPALGSCGYTNSDTDMVCAVSHILFDAASISSNPNDNPLCGLNLRLRRSGKSVDVKIVDRCVGCAVTDLDVTDAVFEQVANLAQGRVSVEWSWLEKPPVNVAEA